MSLKHKDILRLKKNPLLLVGSGLLRIKSAFEMQSDGTYRELMYPRSVPFFPRWEQQVVIRARAECNARNLPCNLNVAKARDVGLSAIASALCVSETIFADNGRMLGVSVDPDTRDKVMYSMLRDMLLDLPVELVPQLTKNSSRYIEWNYRNNPSPLLKGTGFFDLRSAMLQERTAVGQRVSHIWITEYSKFTGAEDVIRGLGDTQMPGRSFRLKESTCEGPNTLHFKEWIHSWRLQGNCNFYEPGFNWESNASEIAMFFPWFHSPARIIDFPRDVKPEDLFRDMIDYEEEAFHKYLMPYAKANKARIGLKSYADAREYCLRQLYWHRSYCSMLPEFDFANRGIRLVKIAKNLAPNLATKRKECPLNWQEAFADDGSAVFHENCINRHKENIREPLVGIVTDDGKFIEDGTGWLRLYYSREELKEHSGYAPPEVLFLGADVAHGDRPDSEATDFSTIVGFHCPSMEQRLEVECRCTVPVFHSRMKALVKWLSRGTAELTPFLCVESTGPGRGIAQGMAAEPQYQETARCYYTQRVDDQKRPFTGKPGFEVTVKSDPYAWKRFEELVLTYRAKIHSARMIEQLSYLVRKPNGSLTAPNKGTDNLGSKDDLCDAAKMALWFLTEVLDECNGDISMQHQWANVSGEVSDWEDPSTLPMTHEKRIEWIMQQQNRVDHGIYGALSGTGSIYDVM